jgi:hypothetical protein
VGCFPLAFPEMIIEVDATAAAHAKPAWRISEA